MAKKEEAEEHEPLTEEQRITALEQKVGTNKLVLFSMALFLIIIISVSITIFIITSMNKKEEGVKPEVVTALETEVTSLKEQLTAQTTQLKKSIKNITLLEEQVASSSNKKLKDIIIEQEQSHQEFFDAVRTGMYDLAHMLPGSRTWLDVYNEKLDKADFHSKGRVLELKKLEGDNPEQSDAEFSDF